MKNPVFSVLSKHLPICDKKFRICNSIGPTLENYFEISKEKMQIHGKTWLRTTKAKSS